jgi:hypothetical protein
MKTKMVAVAGSGMVEYNADIPCPDLLPINV